MNRLTILSIVASSCLFAATASASTSTGASGDETGSSECPETDDLEFVTPLDGEQVTSPFTVELTMATGCACDTDGCFAAEPSNFVLSANGEVVTSCFDCPGSFEVELPPGAYTLEARGEFDFAPALITAIDITVVEGSTTSGGPSDTTGGPSDTTGGPSDTTGASTGSQDPPATSTTPQTTGSADDSSTDDSGGCTTGGTSTPLALALLPLAAWTRRRRRQ